MEDEIDILSEGAMEREIMMDQIRMGDIRYMEHFNKYNLHVRNARKLNINDSNSLSDVSSDDSGQSKGDDDDK